MESCGCKIIHYIDNDYQKIEFCEMHRQAGKSQRHEWDTNPEPLVDEPETAVTIDGFDALFPPPMTPGERHRLQEIETIHAELNAAGVPEIIGNIRLTVSGRVKLLLSYKETK